VHKPSILNALPLANIGINFLPAHHRAIRYSGEYTITFLPSGVTCSIGLGVLRNPELKSSGAAVVIALLPVDDHRIAMVLPVIEVVAVVVAAVAILALVVVILAVVHEVVVAGVVICLIQIQAQMQIQAPFSKRTDIVAYRVLLFFLTVTVSVVPACLFLLE
jgi:hypothetical protein